MHIFISGIAGSGLSSLAHLCLDLGYSVSGSDLVKTDIVDILITRGLKFEVGQNPEFLTQQNSTKPIDYYIYTPALPLDSAEKAQAQNLNLNIGKQNLLINQIIAAKNLKLIAVAGTHGKTTTTAMLVWMFKQLNIAISYVVGTPIPFGNSGQYQENSQYLVYEADEYDKKFLDLKPDISLVASLDYDHPDIYPTPASYYEAFVQFCDNSQNVISHSDISKLEPFLIPKSESKIPTTFIEVSQLLDTEITQFITLNGIFNRQNAQLALFTISQILAKNSDKEIILNTFNKYKLIQKINQFPGTSRRFEKLGENLYTDYAHHPSEIRATLELAREFLKAKKDKQLIVVYQPHQNSRQHQIFKDYKTCFDLADTVYWLPTYLSRENSALATLSPLELSLEIQPSDKVQICDLDQVLVQQIKADLSNENFVLLFGAGNIDEWFRGHLAQILPKTKL